MRAASDLHQLGLFLGQNLVHLGDVPVGEFLDVVLGAALVILRNLMFLEASLRWVLASRRRLRIATLAVSRLLDGPLWSGRDGVPR